MGSKKGRVKNSEIIHKLVKAGLVPYSRYSVWDRLSDRHLYKNLVHRSNLSDYSLWDGKTGPYSFSPSRQLDLYIPIDIYKKYTDLKFTPQLNIGDRVRVRSTSTRSYDRNQHNQNVGDIFDWKHLGIGSGKEYSPEGDDIDKDNFVMKMNNKLLLNYKAAQFKAKQYQQQDIFRVPNYLIKDGKISPEHKKSFRDGIDLLRRRENSTSYIFGYTQISRFVDTDFYKFETISGNGVLGLKNRVEGYITDVFIYMKYPIWKSKREARYEVLFDTGAKAIFTADWLKKTFTTDYDFGEVLSICEFAYNCDCNNCDHKKPHIYNVECEDKCNRYEQDKGCIKIYDYSNLADLTVGKGILEK